MNVYFFSFLLIFFFVPGRSNVIGLKHFKYFPVDVSLSNTQARHVPVNQPPALFLTKRDLNSCILRVPAQKKKDKSKIKGKRAIVLMG